MILEKKINIFAFLVVFGLNSRAVEITYDQVSVLGRLTVQPPTRILVPRVSQTQMTAHLELLFPLPPRTAAVEMCCVRSGLRLLCVTLAQEVPGLLGLMNGNMEHSRTSGFVPGGRGLLVSPLPSVCSWG